MVESKVYKLSLARSYVRHWGIKEAARELIQNALDHESDFSYRLSGGSLVLTSRYASLSPRTLLLGATSKADDPDSIGSFGEGYKLALLVLTRCERPVVIHNGAKLWTPSFQHDADYGEEMLVVSEVDAPFDNEAVEFVVSDLTSEEQAEIREMCLFMQGAMDDVLTVDGGRILPSRPGKLYVGGLFVCDTKMTYGYDVSPRVLTLERDRQTVASYQFEMCCARMWMNTEQLELVARLMEEGVKDVDDMRYMPMPGALKDACARRYIKRYGSAVPVSSQQEAEDRNAVGMKKTAYVGEGYRMAITSSAHYKESGYAVTPPPSPRELMAAWLEANKKYMPRLPKVAFKNLHDQAARWRLQ